MHREAQVNKPALEHAPAAQPGKVQPAEQPILALQRLAGNAAVSELLAQRQPPPPGGGGGAGGGKFDPTMIKLTSPDPTFTGNVKASAQGSDVVLDAPDVVISAGVTVDAPPGPDGWNGMGVGARIDIGATQSVMGSNRSGIYHVGGDPALPVVGESKSTVRGPLRDAQTDPKTKKVAPNVVAPWYELPTGFSDGQRTGTVHFYDKPGTSFPIKLNDGVLTETKGEDRFITGIAAKSESLPLTHLHQYEWAVPWQMQIDHSGSGAGLAATGKETKAIPPTLDGPIAGEKEETWTAFNSVADAMKQPTQVLLRYLGPAKTNDPAAYATILEALKQKKPTMSITITVDEKDNIVASDDVFVGIQEVEFKAGSLNKGQTGTATFDLWQMFFDPGRIDSSTALVVRVIHRALVTEDVARLTIHYPFIPDKPAQVRVGSGRYFVSWTWS